MDQQNIKVVIVGGGVTGLAAAYRFQEASQSGIPVSFTLVEGSPHFGGKILTERIDGFLIEGGPESFVSYKPWALEICEKLGLSSSLIGTNRGQHRVFTLRNNRLVELPQGLLVPTRLLPFFSSRALSLRGKIRMLGDLFLPKRQEESDESVAEFVRRRLGPQALERLVEPLLSGIYAGDVERISLKSAFPLFYEMERDSRSLILGLMKRKKLLMSGGIPPSPWTPFVTLKEGTGQLVETWIKQLPPSGLLCGRRVRKIGPVSKNLFRVYLDGGEMLEADAVILTTPAFGAAELVREFAPMLAEELRQIPYCSTATISLGYKDTDFPHPLNGYGFIVPRVERKAILAATWTSTKFPHRVPKGHLLIRCFVGGTLNESVLEEEDRPLIQRVKRELKEIMGVTAEPVLERVYRWNNATPQYVIGHSSRLKKMENVLSRFPGIYLAGAAYRGIGIPDCIHQGSLAAESALESFRLASRSFPSP